MRRLRIATVLASTPEQKDLFERGLYNYDKLIDFAKGQKDLTLEDYINIIDKNNLWLTTPRTIPPDEDEFVQYHKTGYIQPSAYRGMWKKPDIVENHTEKYPALIESKKIGGYTVEFRQSGEKLKYVKWVGNEIARDEKGDALLLSPEEIKEKGFKEYDTTVYAFIGNRKVGYASDEWGADGVWVDPEFQKLGIGTHLLYLFRKQFSDDRKIGQMTTPGELLTRSYYRRYKKPNRNQLARRLAFPYDLERWDNIHHSEIKNTMSPKDPIIVYHGTSTIHFDKMLKGGGINPSPGITNYSDVTSGGIYVTVKQQGALMSSAASYGWRAVENVGGHIIILTLVVPYGWLEVDPDDTIYDTPEGRVRHKDLKTPLPIDQASTGTQQAVIRKEIPIRMIKEVMLYNEDLGTQADFDALHTPSLPLGRFLDLIKKESKKKNLPPDILALVQSPVVRPTRQPVQVERTQELAGLLEGLLLNYVEFDTSLGQKTFLWVRKNNIQPYTQAGPVIFKLIQDLVPDRLEYAKQYLPYPEKLNLPLQTYLERYA